MLLQEPTLEPGEVEIWRAPANRAQGWRAVGGSLHLTDRRLVFVPQRFEARVGGKRWTRPLAQLVDVAQVPRRLALLFQGGTRRRLALTFEDGTQEVFVVGSLSSVEERLRLVMHAARRE